jgi:hypothetical protein
MPAKLTTTINKISSQPNPTNSKSSEVFSKLFSKLVEIFLER